MKGALHLLLSYLRLLTLLMGSFLAIGSCGSEPTPIPGECIPVDDTPTPAALSPNTANIFWDASGSMTSNAALSQILINSLDSRVLQHAGITKIEHFLVGNRLTQVPTANDARRTLNESSSLQLAAIEAGRRLAMRQIGIAIIISDLELVIDPALIKKGGDVCTGVPMPSTGVAGAIFGRCLAAGFRGESTFPAPILLPKTEALTGAVRETDVRSGTAIGDDSLLKPDSPVNPPTINSLFVAAFHSGPGPLKRYRDSTSATDMHVLIISLDPQLGERVATELLAVLPMRSQTPRSPTDEPATANFTESLLIDTSVGDLGALRCSWDGLGAAAVSPYALPGTCAFDCMREQTSFNLLCKVGEPLQLQTVAPWLPPSDVQVSVSNPERMLLRQPMLQSATNSAPSSFEVEIGCGVDGTSASSPLGACGTEPVITLSATLTGGWRTDPTLLSAELASVSNSPNVQQVYRGLVDAVTPYLPQRAASVSLQLCDE